MRHRIGIVLAFGMLAALFFGGAWGYLRLLRLPAPGTQLTGLPAGGGQLVSDSRAVTALIAVAATGLLAGFLIAMPRVSPLATGLPGLVLLGWTGLYLVNVRQATDLIPLRSDAFGAGFEAMLYNGTLAAAGFAMIVPMLVPSRWRRRVAAGPDTFPIGMPADIASATTAPTPVSSPVPSPVVEPSAVLPPPPVTRMERVATGPAPAAADSPWIVAQRAAVRSGTDSFPPPSA